MYEPNVFAITGIQPEQLAYAMARYSRSPDSFLNTLNWLKDQTEKASSFLDTFYYQYGHASIGDMAMIPLCMEGISMIAAIEVENEQLWSGQERSTRYQDFTNSGHVIPPELHSFGNNRHWLYESSIKKLMDAYSDIFIGVYNVLVETVKRPGDMKEDAFKRTLRARAFDVARSLIPYAMKTSVGQITSARTLEGQLNRLLTSNYRELEYLAVEMLQALSSRPFSPLYERMNNIEAGLVEMCSGMDLQSRNSAAQAANLMTHEAYPTPVAPTLVKHVKQNQERIKREQEIREFVASRTVHVYGTGSYDGVSITLGGEWPYEVEMAATIIYKYSHIAYQTALWVAQDNLGKTECAKLIDLAMRLSDHEEIPREFHTGDAIAFDIEMDGKGMQDFFRHRNCIQIRQEITQKRGFDRANRWFSMGLPEETVKVLEEQGYLERFDTEMENAKANYGNLHAHTNQYVANYILPVGYKRRALFKMSPAQAAYIIETRTKPQGHFSYRKIAFNMWKLLMAEMPLFAKHIKVTPFEGAELLAR